MIDGVKNGCGRRLVKCPLAVDVECLLPPGKFTPSSLGDEIGLALPLTITRVLSRDWKREAKARPRTPIQHPFLQYSSALPLLPRSQFASGN